MWGGGVREWLEVELVLDLAGSLLWCASGEAGWLRLLQATLELVGL